MVEVPEYPSLVTQGGAGYASIPSPASDAVAAAPPPLKNPDTNNPPAPLQAIGFESEERDAPENIWNEWTAAPGGSWNQDLSLKTR